MSSFLSLPTELTYQVEANLPFNTLLALRQTSHRLYNEITPIIWRTFLKETVSKRSLDPKATFHSDIHNVLPHFWHMHPQGIAAYQTLKHIANNTQRTPIFRLYEIENVVHMHHTAAMITVAHPAISNVVLEALHTTINPFLGSYSSAFSLFANILKTHPEIVIFTLQSVEFKNTFLFDPQSGFRYLKDIATHYEIIHPGDNQWTINIDPAFKSTLIQLSNLVLKTLQERQRTELTHLSKP